MMKRQGNSTLSFVRPLTDIDCLIQPFQRHELETYWTVIATVRHVYPTQAGVLFHNRIDF